MYNLNIHLPTNIVCRFNVSVAPRLVTPLPVTSLPPFAPYPHSPHCDYSWQPSSFCVLSFTLCVAMEDAVDQVDNHVDQADTFSSDTSEISAPISPHSQSCVYQRNDNLAATTTGRDNSGNFRVKLSLSLSLNPPLSLNIHYTSPSCQHCILWYAVQCCSYL